MLFMDIKLFYSIPLGQAASWNTKLIRQGASMTAIEAAEDGILHQ